MPRRPQPEPPPEPKDVRRADYGSYLLTPRDKGGLLFTGEQKYVRYDALGQQFAEGYAPAINVRPLGLRRTREQKEAKEAQQARSNDTNPQEKPTRRGYRGTIPWPEDYRKRIHAVGSIVDRWEKKMGFAKTWRPALDQPKWATLTEAGLRYLGLPYEEVDWPDTDTEYELEHYHHISMVRLYLARRRTKYIPEHNWICERELDLLDMPRKLRGEDGFGSFVSAARFCRAFDEVRHFFRFRTTIGQSVSLTLQRDLFRERLNAFNALVLKA